MTRIGMAAVIAAVVVVVVACGRDTGPSPTFPPPVSVARGETLYAANCQSCHGGPNGGSMMDIPPPHNANGHTWHHSDCDLIRTVLDGPGQMSEMMRQMMQVSPDTPRMPAFRGKLTDDEVESVIDYIKTWWSPEQRDHQARVTKQVCRR